MTVTRTRHFRWGIPDFDTASWHTEFADLVNSLDRSAYGLLISTGTTLWANSTAYAPGDLVISPDDGTIWVCNVTHTSSASPTTFEADRSTHFNYWTGVVPEDRTDTTFNNTVHPATQFFTMWLEMDAFLPGIVTRETSDGDAAFTQAYLEEKIRALHANGFHRFIIHTITDNTRTFTDWSGNTPVDPDGVEFHFWYEDVEPGIQEHVDNFDILEAVINICDQLDTASVIIGLGRHGDLELLNDMYTVWASNPDPLRFSKTVTVRKNEEIARYTNEAAALYSRFGSHVSFGGFYISHEPDHIQSAVALVQPIADALRSYGFVHIAPSTPTDFAVSNTIADALNDWHIHWVWPQTSTGYGYNWATQKNAYVSGISVFGAAAHLEDWRDLVELARTRPGGVYAPYIGGHLENWRVGVQGVGTLSFAATTGSDIVVTLGTASSIVAGDVGKDINTRSGMVNGVARIISITDPTHVRVNITEDLDSTSVTSGFWALVPDLTDEVVDAYPATAGEVILEAQTIASYVDDLSIYAEVYWDPGNLTLRLRQSQGPVTDYRTRGVAGWVGMQSALVKTADALRFISLNTQGIEDPAADRILFWDTSAGIGLQGQFDWLEVGNYLEFSDKTLQLSHTPAVICFVARGVDFNSANTDTEIPITLPAPFTRYAVNAVRISHASHTLTTATAGLFSLAAGAGTAIVTGGSAITVASGTAEAANSTQSMTVNNAGTVAYDASSLFFRVGTAEGAAATADVIIVLSLLS